MLGEELKKFEKKIEKFLKVKHVLGVGNWTEGTIMVLKSAAKMPVRRVSFVVLASPTSLNKPRNSMAKRSVFSLISPAP